jgi:hypothetical protein
VSPVKYEPGFYIPEDGILHSHRGGNLKSYLQCLLTPEISIAYVYFGARVSVVGALCYKSRKFAGSIPHSWGK